MISLDVLASDYMEGTSVPDAEIEVTLRIVAWRFANLPDVPGDGPGAPSPGSGIVALRTVPGATPRRRGVRGGVMARRAAGRTRVPIGQEDLPVEVAVTDAQGRASFHWDTSPGSPFYLARQRLLAKDQQLGDPFIEAQLLLEASCDGVLLAPDPLTTSRDYATFTQSLSFDFAESIVGHTSERTSVLWFLLHGTPPSGASYFCEVLPLQARVPPRGVENVLTRDALNFDPRSANATVLEATGLDPGTGYRYRLVIERPRRVGGVHRRVLATGSFMTASTDQEELRIAFASCHKPEYFERCVALAEESCDLTILMGDQIYEPQYPVETGWLDSYINRYRFYWRKKEFRNVLRHGATYMILDDHEVADDWGSFFTVEDGDFRDRVEAGLSAYRLFQDSHNPEAVRRWRDDKYHYSFQRGRVAFFVLDERSQRGRPSGSAILGAEQRADFLAWTQTQATRDADVIVLVSAVPLAFIPAEDILGLVNWLRPLTGGAVGALGGALFGQPLAGGLAGLLFGGDAGEAILEDVTDGALEWREERLVSPDLRDHWSTGENQADLDFVLTALFDLANDVIDRGAHPRLVFVLAGDTHIGAAHTISSSRLEHARRPTILQLMSSPLSRSSLGAKSYLNELGFFTNEINLVSSGDYRALLHSEWLDQRNYGTLLVQRRPGNQGRVYVISWTLEGRTEVLSEAWVEDLDA